MSFNRLAAVFQEMAEVSSDVFWVVDDTTGRTIYVSPAFATIWGRPVADVVADPGIWSAGVHPEDRAEADRLFRERHGAGRYDHVFRVLRPDGATVWVRDRGWRVAGRTDEGPLFVGIAEDVTAQVMARQRQEMLMNEVDHRAKNTLAIIQSIVLQSSRGAESVPALSEAIVERIQAIARTHDLLRTTHWRGAAVADLAADELSAYAAESRGNVVIDGPPVLLGPEASAALGLTLHELATNAAKYGGLSAPEGRLVLRWHRDEGGVHLDWTEESPRPVSPPTRRGFGSRLVERMIGLQLDGTVRLSFPPEGLRCTVTIPARHLAPDADDRAA